MNQKAEAKQGSTVIQVAGDYCNGISFTECERLFHLLLTENFPKLEEIAAKKAKENVDSLVELTFKKIESRISQIAVEKLAQPDVQYTFNNAVQGAAKKGQKIDIDLLAELLESRIEKGNTDYLDNCIEASVDLVPKLTSEMLLLLPALHFIQGLIYNNHSQLDNLYGAIFEQFLSKCDTITPAKLKTMASIGVGNYINVTGGHSFEEMKEKYPHLKTSDAKSQHPNVVKTLDFYDKNKLYQITLTTPGQVIAVKMLSKILPGINLHDCIQ